LDDAPDEQVFAILRQRLAANDEASQFSQEILMIDEAMALFDKPDQKEVFNATKAAATTVSAAQTFTDTYRKKLREAADAAKGPGAKAKPKKYAKPSLRVPDTFNIAHAEAKALLPVGASVWRGHQ